MKQNVPSLNAVPFVVSTGAAHTITISGKLSHPLFAKREYDIEICAMLQGTVRDYPELGNSRRMKVRADSHARLVIQTEFEGEQEHFIFVTYKGRRIGRASVYSIGEDLIGLYPYRGDLHLHTKRSDGKFSPSRVAAVYRKEGYDFLTISDHRRYYPSLEAMKFVNSLATELTVVPGEEIHMPDTDLHIVNFGGEYSVNGIWKDSKNCQDKGEGAEYRSENGKCPPMLTTEEYGAEIDAIESTLSVPEGVNKRSYAVLLWICRHIRAANGMSIFAHPCWISRVQQVPERYREYIMAERPFDAFEVLGGERYFEQNGFQTIQYYNDIACGNRYPIVGSTDSHLCLKAFNPRALLASTIVFCKANTRQELIDGIKDYKSVAVDTLSREFRLVGDMRLVRYACFLMNNYYPLQNKIARKEGRMMNAVLCGVPFARAVLKRRTGGVHRLQLKYFDF